MSPNRSPFKALALAVSVAAAVSGKAQALPFNVGDVEGDFDTRLSFTTDWGLRDADHSLVGASNGGSGHSSLGDDGRLNFDRGQAFSKRLQGEHALTLKYGDSGVYVRGRYWYDFAQMDGAQHFKSISDQGREEGARAAGGQWLDAYVYHHYSIGDQPGTLRVGRQVVNWGESVFIGNSINSINPVDLSTLHQPGEKVADSLLPTNLLYVSQSLTDTLTLDAFYQLQWDASQAENCGTYFADDITARGCSRGFTVASSLPAQQGQGYEVTREGVVVPRGHDDRARDGGQWGTALHWLVDDVDYGVYFMNYHSRQAFIQTRNGGGIPSALGTLSSSQAQDAALLTGSYNLEYPQDIQLYGASFSTVMAAGATWRGELSYRPDAPVQRNLADLTQALYGAAGQVNQGYERKAITQLQSSLSQDFDEVLGAERLSLVAEAGWVHVDDVSSSDRLGRDAVFGTAGSHGFVTSNAWGYRAQAQLDYANVFQGVNLKPSVAWSHDVSGYGPNGLFNEGAKAVTLGLAADVQQTYTAQLAYTQFFGGHYNVLEDRDFLSMTVGVNF
ncbi:protein AidA [Pseudomonas sp. M47T1]|uniref:DUF1302 domain-containing protein n=1 Tax=unclassified Pseudomonas TaxID=196821 RepID=UPI0002608C52|nr:DUF1302 domain-containing protein [Pseudomonas sp. M47T1]EIK95276.1 protein AidA [Pseudomonas sp. M47T1]